MTGANTVFAGTLTTAAKGIATASLPAGSVLQVIQASFGGVQTMATSQTWTDISSLSAAITPSNSSNKVLAVYSINTGQAENQRGALKIIRGSTEIGIADAQSNRIRSSTVLVGIPSALHTSNSSHSVLDSPNTTSATTYKTQFNSEGAGETVVVQANGSISTITLMEIAG